MYVGADDNKLYAFGLDGTPLWEFTTGGNVRTTPLVLPDGIDRVRVVRRQPLRRRFQTGNPFPAAGPSRPADKFRFSSPAYYASATDLIVAGSEDGNLYALDATTGMAQCLLVAAANRRRRYTPPPPSTPRGWRTSARLDGMLRAVDLGSGSELSCVPSGPGRGRAIRTIAGLSRWAYLFVGTDDGQGCTRSTTSDGTSPWPAPFQAGGTVTSSPAIDPLFGQLYFGSDDFNVYAIDLSDGTETMALPDRGSYVRSSPSVDGGRQRLRGLMRRKRLRASTTTGTRWTRRSRSFTSSGLIIPSPTIGNDGLLYIGSDDRFVHAIGPDPFGALPRAELAPRLDEMTPASGIQGHHTGGNVAG